MSHSVEYYHQITLPVFRAGHSTVLQEILHYCTNVDNSEIDKILALS